MRCKLPLRIVRLTRELRALSKKLDQAQQFVFLRAEAINLKEGDILVFSSPHRLSPNAYARIGEVWESRRTELGFEGVRVLVIDAGMTVSVLRREHVKATDGVEAQAS